MRNAALVLAFIVGGLACGAPDHGEAASAAPIVITLKGHHFTPRSISAPSGQQLTIQVQNLDGTPEEFESYDLKIEKILAAHTTITVRVRPLKPGSYKFFGDYNPDLAKGVLTILPAGAR